jgi:GMP synthase-like glutamine amidotransferase
MAHGLVLQNDTLDPPALLGDWLDERGIPFEVARVFEDGVPPDPRRFDWIASMGSRHSVNDAHPDWIPAEVGFLRDAVAEDVPVLGICFGGQALAAALGGEVSLAEPPAVGWFETQTSDPGLVSIGPWLHFNSERFAVPDGATLVASLGESASAFRLGPHLGLQFHPEATPALAGRWGDHYTEWLAEHGLLTPAGIRDQAKAQADEIGPRAFALFDAWWAGVRAPA